MRDLLAVVLEVGAASVQASLAEVDRPGAVLRTLQVDRSRDLAADTAAALGALEADDLAVRLLALAVAVADDVDEAEAHALVQDLGGELPPGWGLPASLPVVAAPARTWRAAGASVVERPLVAGAVVVAARSVGAHAHLPPAP